MSAAVGLDVPPQVRLAVIVSSAAIVTILSMATGLILRSFRLRTSHSEMIGAIVGAMCAAASLRPLWLWLELGDFPPLVDLLQFALALAIAISIGFASAQLGHLCERNGAAASGALLWSLAALLLASAGHLAGARSTSVSQTLAALASGSIAASLVCAVAFLASRRRGLALRVRGGKLLFGVALIGGAVYLSPAIMPWVFFDAEINADAQAPPNVLVVALSRGGRDRLHGPGGLIHVAPTLGVTAWSGVTYPNLGIDPRSSNVLSSALTLSDGSALPRVLRQRGYTTDQIAGSTDALAPIDSIPFRERLSPARWLVKRGRWLSTAPLLGGLAGASLDAWGLLSARRELSDVTRDALGWLVDWRTGNALTPFLLFVDLRSSRPDGNLAAADIALAKLLDHVEKLEATGRTFVLLLLEESRGHRAQVIAIASPPRGWPLPGPETRGAPNVAAQALADALAQASLGPASRPTRLPGIAGGPSLEISAYVTTAGVLRPEANRIQHPN